ncbi:hypothetical protein BS50DRAFT_368547 [Corynespora cassiicola Philippines]|uniref:Uncharacterized protein n=1 Tax=Corynespora cassiicola Philippines TaxID=1448308 RepID=A0A2T2MZW3_CORCC|nr:hypothetical protein BS50DRAFT_368547 [Corynespora cassiicola Philippines]
MRRVGNHVLGMNSACVSLCVHSSHCSLFARSPHCFRVLFFPPTPVFCADRRSGSSPTWTYFAFVFGCRTMHNYVEKLHHYVDSEKGTRGWIT